MSRGLSYYETHDVLRCGTPVNVKSQHLPDLTTDLLYPVRSKEKSVLVLDPSS